MTSFILLVIFLALVVYSFLRINEYLLLIRLEDIRRLKLILKKKEVILVNLLLILLLVNSIIGIYFI